MQLAPQKEKIIIRYNDFLPRLIFAIVAAHSVVNHGENYSFVECLFMPNYYYSLAGSLLISFTITQLIYFITCRLDGRYGWEKDFLKRLTYQLIFGVFSQIATALIGAAVYFYVFDLEMKNTRYIKFILPNIVLMILLCNFYYALHYFVRLFNSPTHLKPELVSIAEPLFPIVLPAVKPPEIFLDLQIPVLEQIQEIQPDILINQPEIWKEDDILLLYILNSITYVVMRDGSNVVWTSNIKESMKHLSSQEYFKIRPSVIVKRGTIATVKKVNSKTYVLLNFPFKHELTISSRNLTAFKKWFKG
jgi:hypothetical protein